MREKFVTNRFCLVAILPLFISICTWAETEIGEQPVSFSDASRLAKTQIDQLKSGTYKSSYEKTEIYHSLDNSVKKVVLAAFQESNSFDEVKAKTPNFISWYEFLDFYNPDKPLSYDEKRKGVYDYKLSEEEWLAEENSVNILYRRFKVDEETELFYLQNSLWANQRTVATYRDTYSHYLIITYKNEVELTTLTPPVENDYYSSSNANGRTIPLGFIRQEDAFPILVTLNGPLGRMNVISVTLYTFAEEEKTWEKNLLFMVSTFAEYKYNKDTSTLSFMLKLPDPEDDRAYIS